MDETYRLYVSTSCKAFLADPNKDPNALEAYLTDTQNRVLPKRDAAFFENKQKPKPLKHLLRAGKEVQVCSISKTSAPLPQGSFIVGKAFRVPGIVYSTVSCAAEMSQSAYNSAVSAAVEKYGQKIVSAQASNDEQSALKLRAELEQATSAMPKPITFEQLVKHLAEHLLKNLSR